MINTKRARRIPAQHTILIGLIAAVAASGQTTGYTITTVVGNGTSGFSGDGGAAINALLSNPGSVAVDSSGNLYIADSGNHRIRKVSNGTISTVAGNGAPGFSGDGGAATSAALFAPSAVAVDSAGNLYIADTNNDLIRKVDTKGTISTYAGNPNNGSPTLTAGFLDSPTATTGSLNLPTGVAVDASGNLYISDFQNNRIRKVSSSGALTTIVNSNGVAGSAGDGNTGLAARINGPLGITVDKAGNIYFADSNNSKIRKISTAGIISTVAGTGFSGFSGDGGLATNAQLATAPGVAVDGAGNVYIADKLNSRVRVVSPSGIISTIAGKSPAGYTGDGSAATSAQLKLPQGVAVDGQGNVYVADTQNSAIRLLTPAATGGGGLPGISSGGVANAGAFGGSPATAPGSWIEIFGSNLAASTREWGGGDFVGNTAPTSLDKTSVFIGGQAAFVRYISPTQVNVQVPSNVVTGTQPIVVNTSVGSSAAYNITVNATQPGMLAPSTFLIGGKQYAVAQFSDFTTYVLPANAIAGVASRPAKPGETITLYGIGFGPVTPNTPAGQIVQANNSLTLPLQVQIGSSPAVVSYAGLATTLVGLYQFNVVIPTIADNDAAPITFTLGNNAPQTLYIAVKN